MIRKIASQRCILPIVCCLFITVGVSTKSLAQLPGAAGEALSLASFVRDITKLVSCTMQAEYAFGTDDQGRDNVQKFNQNLSRLFSLAEHCTFSSPDKRQEAENYKAIINQNRKEAHDLYHKHFNPNTCPVSVGLVKIASCMTAGFATPVLNDFCQNVGEMFKRIIMLNDLVEANKCIGVP